MERLDIESTIYHTSVELNVWRGRVVQYELSGTPNVVEVARRRVTVLEDELDEAFFELGKLHRAVANDAHVKFRSTS
jgi:hypothetical protein